MDLKNYRRKTQLSLSSLVTNTDSVIDRLRYYFNLCDGKRIFRYEYSELTALPTVWSKSVRSEIFIPRYICTIRDMSWPKRNNTITLATVKDRGRVTC